MSDTLHVVVNPAAGARLAPEFVEQHVVPLLKTIGQDHIVHTTTAPSHAGQLAREILASATDSGGGKSLRVRVVLVGGDGTTHEFLAGLLDTQGELADGAKWDLAVLPLGTANALFYSLFPSQAEADVTLALPDRLKTAAESLQDADTRYKLSSLLSLLSGSTSAGRPLPITRTTLSRSDGSTAATLHSHIVLSTSLHAALLSTSEELRAEYPGLERFKIAAERNASVFFDAQLGLLGPVRQYDPHSATFKEPFTFDKNSLEQEGGILLEGPFAYVLTTTLADRLEPAFQIMPTRSGSGGAGGDDARGTLDMIVLRPLRDPRVASAIKQGRPEAEAEVRALWAKRAFQVIGAAYANGAHVRRTYPLASDEEGVGATEDLGEGPVAVEVYRCAGFEWAPTPSEHKGDGEKNRIVCADGAIHLVPPGGKARAEVLRAPSQGGFYVYGP